MNKTVVTSAAVAAVLIGGYAYNVYESKVLYNREAASELQLIRDQGQLSVDRKIDESTPFRQTETITFHYVDPRLDRIVGPLVLHQVASFAGIGPSGDWRIDLCRSHLTQGVKDNTGHGFRNHGQWHFSIFTGKGSGTFQLDHASFDKDSMHVDIQPLNVRFTGSLGDKRCLFSYHWGGLTLTGDKGPTLHMTDINGNSVEDYSGHHRVSPQAHMAIAKVRFIDPRSGATVTFDNAEADGTTSFKNGFYDIKQHFQADDAVVNTQGKPETFSNPQIAYRLEHLSEQGIKAFSHGVDGGQAAQMQHLMQTLNLFTQKGASFSLDKLSVTYRDQASTASGQIAVTPTDVTSAGIPALLHGLNGKANLTLAKSLESFSPALHGLIQHLQQQGLVSRDAAGNAKMQVQLNNGKADVNGHVIPLG